MFPRRCFHLAAFALAAGCLALAGASQALAQELTLDAIFAEGHYDADGFGPARWLDPNRYATVEPSTTIDGARDLIAYDAPSGARSVLVGAHELVGEFQDEALLIEDYAFSPDQALLLIYTNSRRVWRSNSRGDYWVFDLEDRTLRRLGPTRDEAELMFAKFSPDSTRVAYVRRNDLFMEDLRTGAITRLTQDGSDTIINGTFDWVYEEELSLRDGFRWSPDGSRIAFWQLDSSLVEEFVLVNYTAGLYPELTRFPYPKAGEVNSAARIGVIPAGGGEIVWANFRGSPRDFYLARMDWASPNDLIVQRLNRRQNRNEVALIDATSGRPSRLFVETDDAWVDIRDDLHWLQPAESFTWVSERDGWRRVYRVHVRSGAFEPLTPAGVDVMSVDYVDSDGGALYYTASPDDAGQRYLYRAEFAPGMTGDPGAEISEREPTADRLTPVEQPGTHSYQIAPGAGWALHTWSRFAQPPRTGLVALPDHSGTRTLEGNADLRRGVAALGIDHEFMTIDIGDGVTLDGWVMRPGDFDPTGSYPVLFYVYGEPWGQTVLDRWGGRRLLWHQYLTELGYVVMSVDNRGTPAPRGRDWRKVVYGEIGTLAAADQAAAVRALADQHAWIDSSRIAIWGWSGGGSMTLNAMFRYPEIYQTGMSVAPVPDQRYYDTIYQERYMGTPDDNPHGYRAGSPITYASRLQGNLLLVHGTGDDNVHYQGTEALIDRLVAAGKHFTMMAYPNRSHGIFEGEGTTRHLYGLLTRYLQEHTPAAR